ncbi:HSP20 [Phaeodactylum tricornutum CCAP 1055/1]|jgi:HSP20 family molecular chaperone IbpA|uniref:HSP20 n=1 Tax=Phaeodactylum tricornutum (strain CCAP 1055/1) TaxID=556484 RepID=B5Y3Y4_PHATC|nr:HSP20 [Phaeodactylum tricornutum CCAP 1055/1]ACI65213.1 HSP20 [Phaeodactylum tricornutum CCAP 1055/1]|eukprot:XP_002185743.1 HSP20 [Phaeodactylum tricornutum CCAP 1055/1]
MRTTISTIIAILGATALAEGRTHGSVLAPRHYLYSRPRDAFDLVSDMFSIPYFNQDILPSQSNTFLRQMHSQLDRAARSETPRYDVYQDPETGMIEMTMEVPGIHARDLTVELENKRLLRIKGSRKSRQNGSLQESTFEQSFQIDENVDPDNLKVTLSAGILRIQAPKKERLVKRLDIATTGEEASLMVESKADAVHDESKEKTVDGLEISTEDLV